MEPSTSFEQYPIRTVIQSNVVSLGIYGLGIFIMNTLGLTFSILYALALLIFEYRLFRYHCTNCYYWGKTCGFGKGRISAVLFKKGDSSKFCAKKMTWQELIPDILISLIPVVVGIVQLIVHFDPAVLFALILILFLTTTGNGYIRGSLTCKYCKQRELGCPAEMLFSKAR
ncbi:MAG: hypothetical protein EHM64_10840 [Ignavibacteriae bacterium]|nr:MAG: hypothetical protein EHM64_10840 [Ignavibacteriota bacterium]